MYIDIYGAIGLALLFGFCAWWNHKQGVRLGIEATLGNLLENNIIALRGDQIVPYDKNKALTSREI
jgi:hypothetical protein